MEDEKVSGIIYEDSGVVKVDVQYKDVWVPTFFELRDIYKRIYDLENKKYPLGLGGDLFFLAYLWPLHEQSLKSKGIELPKHIKEKVIDRISRWDKTYKWNWFEDNKNENTKQRV